MARPNPPTNGASGKTNTRHEKLRHVPSVDRCLELEPIRLLLATRPRRLVVQAIRETLDDVRRTLLDETLDDPSLDDNALAAAVEQRTDARLEPRVRRVVNATGIILHTGLGRAVLSEEARRAMLDEAAGPAVVEIDPTTNERTVRTHVIRDLLCELTGAESATVVNNNAAATLLILNTLAAGKEVIVSRGELVEIGGSFRMPDVMAKSGAKLVDVGTTNRTHRRDFVEAVTEETGAIFRAHTSNYKVIGFTKAVPLAELVAIGREHGIPVVDDVGSGMLVDLTRFGFGEEPLVPESIRQGADLVCFSGDKLVGGPQAGFIVGRADLVNAIERNSFARTFRCDKVTLAGIEATLKLFLDEERLFERNPTLRMLSLPVESIDRRARSLQRKIRSALPHLEAHVRDAASQLGSGSLPTEDLPTRVVAIRPSDRSCDDLARALRESKPAIFTRVKNDEILIDPRTLQSGEDRFVVEALETLLAASK